MLAAERFTEPAPLSQFLELIGSNARQILIQQGFCTAPTFLPSTLQDYLSNFCWKWSPESAVGRPLPENVVAEMDRQESIIFAIWRHGLHNSLNDHDIPDVIVARVARYLNPLVLPREGAPPLVVMSTGSLNFVLTACLGIMTWAENTGSREALGLRLLRDAIYRWIHGDLKPGTLSSDLAEAATLDLDTTNFAVGVAYAAFSWTFFHEMGHVHLGHLSTGSQRMVIAGGNGRSGSRTVDAIRAYNHSDERAADAFGFERFLDLMPHADEIRRSFPFGPQIDHSPMVFLDLVNLAYLATGNQQYLVSRTHPSPLDRKSKLIFAFGRRLSEDGRDWYEYWSERLSAIARLL